MILENIHTINNYLMNKKERQNKSTLKIFISFNWYARVLKTHLSADYFDNFMEKYKNYLFNFL